MAKHPKTTVSLQQRLVKSSMLGTIFAGLIALVLLMAISAYQSMNVQDEIMDEISDMLLVNDISNVSNSQLDELSKEFDIQYILRNQHYVLSHSNHSNAINENFEPIDKEYGFIWEQGELWRTYIQTNDGLSAYVVQPIQYRLEHLLNSLFVYAVALIVLWLIQWLFIRFLIYRQFKSFNVLASEIAEKNADDLKPIAIQNIEFEELQPMIQQLNQLLKRLDYSLQSEQRFTADASHELRSPLSAIQMRLQVLQRKYKQNDALKIDLNQIQQDVNRGTLVLENLLLLARLDPENTASMPKEKLSVLELVQDVLHALKPFVKEKCITVLVDVEYTHTITGNRQLLFTCLRNLIDNAVRYTPIESLIEIKSETLLNTEIIQIIDRGNTVTNDSIKRMGERFYRALGTKTNGSGLGISICKRIIDIHGGHIEFLKNEFNGLTVILKFTK